MLNIREKEDELLGGIVGIRNMGIDVIEGEKVQVEDPKGLVIAFDRGDGTVLVQAPKKRFKLFLETINIDHRKSLEDLYFQLNQGEDVVILDNKDPLYYFNKEDIYLWCSPEMVELILTKEQQNDDSKGFYLKLIEMLDND